MSRTYRRHTVPAWARQSRTPRHSGPAGYPGDSRPSASGETFRCRHCKLLVGPLPSGGRHRNHCPFCLHSRHVDGRVPGDRASTCGSKMAPVGLFTRSNGEQVIVHRCLGCDFERHNRVAADDNPLAVLRLPLVQPRLSPARHLPQTTEGELTA
ncbi:MAG TPA: RNHCP domain-containing protein [Chloroflexota bacterium]|nr:RNHCP domain-containing protein [Chloroflexota bacterium]